jgi:hypothetical protein
METDDAQEKKEAESMEASLLVKETRSAPDKDNYHNGDKTMPRDLRPKTWMGAKPQVCQICHRFISTGFVDGKVRGMSGWAIMCPACHDSRGCGLGTGRGQRYEAIESEYVKMEG